MDSGADGDRRRLLRNHGRPLTIQPVTHWDTNAQAAYLSIVNPGSANDQFISYDDEHTCQAKVSYARNRRLAGVMIWNLSQGYRATPPAGRRDPLLQAIKQSFVPPRVTNIGIDGQDIHFDFTSLPLGLYRVQWTSNLNATAWNTLTNGLSGTSGTLQVIDRGAIQPVRTILSDSNSALD